MAETRPRKSLTTAKSSAIYALSVLINVPVSLIFQPLLGHEDRGTLADFSFSIQYLCSTLLSVTVSVIPACATIAHAHP